eukprot:870561-Alexandrium_andersonii.AAC.1
MQQRDKVGPTFEWKDGDETLPDRLKRFVHFEDVYYNERDQWMLDPLHQVPARDAPALPAATGADVHDDIDQHVRDGFKKG